MEVGSPSWRQTSLQCGASEGGAPVPLRPIQSRQQRGTPTLLCGLGHITYLLWPWPLRLCRGAFSGSAQLRHSKSLLSTVLPARQELEGVCWSRKVCEGRRPSGWGPRAGQQADRGQRETTVSGLPGPALLGGDPFQSVPQVSPTLGSGFKESGCAFLTATPSPGKRNEIRAQRDGRWSRPTRQVQSRL